VLVISPSWRGPLLETDVLEGRMEVGFPRTLALLMFPGAMGCATSDFPCDNFLVSTDGPLCCTEGVREDARFAVLRATLEVFTLMGREPFVLRGIFLAGDDTVAGSSRSASPQSVQSPSKSSRSGST